MSRCYAIADLHFGHKKVSELRGFQTTKDHDDAIVAAWNSVVNKRDCVYVLGDVFKLDRMPELKGTKKLAMGNHDKLSVDRYAAHFSKVAAYFEYDGCIMSHIPVHEGQLRRYQFNVHGHTHASIIDDPRYIPVSVEQFPGMKPELLSVLLQGRRHE